MIGSNVRKRELLDIDAFRQGLPMSASALADSLPNVERLKSQDGRPIPFNSPGPPGTNGYSPKFRGGMFASSGIGDGANAGGGSFAQQPAVAPGPLPSASNDGMIPGPGGPDPFGQGQPEPAQAGVPIPGQNRMANPGAVDMTGLYDVGKIKTGPNWKKIAGGVGDALMFYSASLGNPASAAFLQNQHQNRRDQRHWEFEEQKSLRERLAKMNEPQQVGSNLVQRDPSGGYKTLYSAPTPAENYASALGFSAGSPEYLGAIEDYALKSWGGTAYSRKSELQGERLDQSNTNNLRSTSTSRDNNIRTTGTSAANNQRSTHQSNVNSVRAAGQSNVNNVRSTATSQRGQDMGGRRGRAASNAARATNPTTGEVMVLRNGQWVKE
jgi:hypothetical protein